MAIEIERKFLLASDAWRRVVVSSARLAQGYLGGDRASVRVRLSHTQAWLNLKSLALGTQRLEFEYEIPLIDGSEILATLCGRVIDKTRHIVPLGDLKVEIDEFHGDNAGLIVAEIELPCPDHVFVRPDWLGAEVSDDVRYFNNQLAQHPFSQWAKT